MFEYFPSNYPWSLTVALSISMGGEMSEIASACRPLSSIPQDASEETSVEAWYQNWVILGERLERLAVENENKGAFLSASRYFSRAANYFLVAERQMGWGDTRRLNIYKRALELFRKSYEYAATSTERVEVTNDNGDTLAGYLALPEGDGPFPAAIFFNGFDSIKEMHYSMYEQDARDRGIAVLFIDQEGTGEAMRLHNVKKRMKSEKTAEAFVDFLEKHDQIDGDKIGVMGLSNGGYDAPRAAAFEKRLKCVAVNGAFYNADDYLTRFDKGQKDSVTHGLSNLDEHMMHVTGVENVEGAFRRFAERDLANSMQDVTVPILVVHGENDRQVPVSHAQRTIKNAVNSPDTELKLFKLSEGSAEHCGIDNSGMTSAYLFDWMAMKLGNDVGGTG